MFANARFGPRPVRRFEQDVDGAVECLLRRLEVPLLELLLTEREVAVRGRDQRDNRVLDGALLNGWPGRWLCRRTRGSLRTGRHNGKGLRVQMRTTCGRKWKQRDDKLTLPA